MRLHLIIQRHGLPVTRILWTTSPPSMYGQATPSSSVVPAASSVIASTRTPNALYSNGGYTVAQLLEDVNEVVPLETEPAIFDSESSGQWGLEDYAVEVGGSECLHFMEVDGLLRDGDEVVIRALQIADLRARRLSGRHQISSDGKHLIDGVPFGRPFLKRQTSSRPAIAIPPRKKRRTMLATWDRDAGDGDDEVQWTIPGRVSSMKELSRLKAHDDDGIHDEYTDYHHDNDYEDYHESQEESGDGTVIRHPLSEGEDDEASESDADGSDFEAEDLAEELEALEKDRETVGLSSVEVPQEKPTGPGGYPLRTRASILRNASGRHANHQAAIKSPSEAGSSRRDSKAVRFKAAQRQASPCPSESEGDSHLSPAEQTSEDSPSIYKSFSSSSSSDTDDSASDDEDSTSPSETTTSASEVSSSESEAEDAESEDEDSSSESDESTTSESEDESLSTPASSRQLQPKMNPPGHGSLRTKKSNQRNKLRRRLSKLKELGALPAEADFAALREWEAKNGVWYEPPEHKPNEKRRTNEEEQEEFEAKRQKLLHALATGGVDVDEVTGKENEPPEAKTTKGSVEGDAEYNGAVVEPPNKRRTLDVASSRRLLFGSLGVRAPRSKEDEEATRKKLAGKVNNFRAKVPEEQAPAEESDSEAEANWQDKLFLKATECVFDDIELSTPPFPFEQRWDAEAHQIIKKRKGWGRKRKRRQQLQVYEADEYEDYAEDNNGHYTEEDMQLNYNDPEQPLSTELTNGFESAGEEPSENTQDDLPPLPADLSSVRDLTEGDLKQRSVIAFKQLVVSKETNWQPTVSDYLVARIDDVFEDNVLRLQLAKRDRRQVEQPDEDDEEDGTRGYDKFEMPGMDDDQAEDDGFREISFADLFDAKLVQTADVADVGGADKVSNSSVAEGSCLQNSKTTGEDETMREAEAVNDSNENSPEPSVSSHAREGLEMPAEETVEAVDHTAEGTGGSSPEEDASPVIQSPQFVGFHSPQAETQPSLPEPSPEPETREMGVDDQSNSLPQPTEAPSTPRSTVPPNAFNDAPSAMGSDEDLQFLSSPDNFVNFNRLLEQLFQGKRPTSGSPGPKKEPSESPKMPRSRASSSSSSFVPNPFYEVDKAHEERLRRRSEKAKGDAVTEKDESGADSAPPKSQLSTPISRKTPTSAQPQRSPTPQYQSLMTSTQESNWLTRHDEESGTQPPTASQLSNIVDLTQSSPPVSPGGSDEDFAKSHRLPRGSGWVQKKVPSTRRRTRLSSSGVRRGR
ncbi:uncharacterized protein P174DRAFT_507055 [Aspergillus novofumigatus IBT 16806]|uniref:DUF7357 domain-containing protein n=1 Tax=Aspergillus novofumigatus (strain IBT 16806) TaxID=1392255 RepID=A0A2I1BY70_ASPN1|nr:uncharacterized protein P174DRAFT_507055 [Aspergillus novofumigatus IBT 16806]PKX90316.1 hypothetical protein P174DRAFT_507055 [Aspergillus novofumigatus IBT 16806]